jgi:hypothetical protein
MALVQHIAKWNLENKVWEKPTFLDTGHCFSIVNYDYIGNDTFDGVNYIIVATGSRLERNTSNFHEIDNRIYRIDNVINHFKNQNGNYQIQTFFIDKDAPIVESAKKFAEYIDSLAINPSVKTINVMGVSKCGTMSFYVPSYFEFDESFSKFNLFNVAAPYQGTKFASPDLIIPEIKDFSTRTFGNNFLGNFLYNKLFNSYRSGSSYSHMDYDVSLIDSIGDEYKNLYDRFFIEQIFSNRNVEAIKRINSFKNFTTKVDKTSLPEAIATFNYWGIRLCLLNDIFFDGKADGLVPYESQKSVDDVVHQESIHLPT